MLAWLGTIFGILGALLVASNIGLNDVGYILFTIGAICSFANAYKKRDNAGMVLWLTFLIINIFGVISYLKG